MLSKLVEEANRKGYSGSYLCELVNRRGIKCHINTFRQAVKDRADRTEGQERIYELASSILKELPCRDLNEKSFAGKAKMAGFTVKQVWERYQATHEKKYSYVSFSCALLRNTSPFEVELMHEAQKCLEDLIAERDG